MEEISNNYKGQDSRELLEGYGFQVLGYSRSEGENEYALITRRFGAKMREVAYVVNLPDGWTVENQGPFHTVFHGPNGEKLWSFIKFDPWDRHSFLEVHN